MAQNIALAQENNESRTEVVVAQGIYDWGYLSKNDVKWCDLPTVDRDGGDRFVHHRLVVETVMDHVTEKTERVPLMTSSRIEYDDCNLHREKIVKLVQNHHGQMPVTLFYTDTHVTQCTEGQFFPSCKHECLRTIETKINEARYFIHKKISEEFCN